MIVGDLIERNARLAPHGTAIVCGKRRFSHAEFAERCRRLANALAGRGIGAGDRVAVLSQNRAEMLEVYGACELAGTIAVPVNYRLAPAEIATIIADAEPAAMVFEAQYAAAVAPLAERFRCALALDTSPEWAEPYEPAVAAADGGAPASRPTAGDTVYLVYTSGTTGRPKGVMLSHRGAVRTAQLMAGEGALEQADRLLLVMPLFHIGGKCFHLGHLWRGCTTVIQPAFDAEAVLDTIAAEGVTTILLAPTMVRAVLDAPGFDAAKLDSLRTLFYSAAPMPEALVRRAMAAVGPILVQFYGMTETGPMGTTLYKHQHVLDGPPEVVRRLASAGQPSPTCEIRVVSDDGADCPVGEPGEVLISGPSVMQGYWRNPEATAEVLRDGWIHTGDIGTLDDEGYLFIVDRKKDIIVSGGENIYPREVEEALHSHPAVAEAAVIGVPDPHWGEAVAALVVLREDAAATEEELTEHCRSLIAGYKRPRRVEWMDALPKLANGKIDKKLLRAPFWAETGRNI